tara:strand:- start:1474 stop:3135 length:1662 start_codon:yes stop_codon:yes gene_type:complete
MVFTFNIQKGWNFISSFGYPNSLTNIINDQSVSEDIVVIFFLNVNNVNGTRYESLTVNDFLEQGKGYWIYSNNTHENVRINGEEHILITTENISLTLKQGWNMMSAPFTNEYNIQDFPFSSRIESIYSYDASVSDYEQIDVSGVMNVGIGYWVKLSSDPEPSELNITYVPPVIDMNFEMKYTRMFDNNTPTFKPNDLLVDVSGIFESQNVVKIEVRAKTSLDVPFGIGAFNINFNKPVTLASGPVGSTPSNWNQYPSGGKLPNYSFTRSAIYEASDDWNIGDGYSDISKLTGTLPAGTALTKNNVINMVDNQWKTLCHVTAKGGVVENLDDLPLPTSSEFLVYPEDKYNNEDTIICNVEAQEAVSLEVKYTKLYDETFNTIPEDLHPDYKNFFTNEAVVKIEVKMSDTNYAIGAFDIGFDKTAKPASGTGGIPGGLKSNWNNYVNDSSGSANPNYKKTQCAVFAASENWNIGYGTGTTYKIFGTLSTGTILNENNAIYANDWVTLCYITTTGDVNKNDDLPSPISTEFLLYPTGKYNHSDRVVVTTNPVNTQN